MWTLWMNSSVFTSQRGHTSTHRWVYTTSTLKGLDTCMCVPLGLELSVYLYRFVVTHYLGQKPCFTHLYCSVWSTIPSISQELLFAGLNECGCDKWISFCMYWQNGNVIYILVRKCFSEHHSFVHLNEWGRHKECENVWRRRELWGEEARE